MTPKVRRMSRPGRRTRMNRRRASPKWREDSRSLERALEIADDSAFGSWAFARSCNGADIGIVRPPCDSDLLAAVKTDLVPTLLRKPIEAFLLLEPKGRDPEPTDPRIELVRFITPLNPGIFKTGPFGNPRNWCPGALVPVHSFDAELAAGDNLVSVAMLPPAVREGSYYAVSIAFSAP